MKTCEVCGNESFHKEPVEEVFHIGDQFVVVQQIPAEVCDRCGEATFDRATTNNIRAMMHGTRRPTRRIEVDVFAYA